MAMTPEDFIALSFLEAPLTDRGGLGYSMRVASGNQSPPGCIALTWITGVDEAGRTRIREHAKQNVADFLKVPGFLSIVTGFIGLRGFTVTAWESEEAMRTGLSGHHTKAMHDLFAGDFVASVWTSVWQPTRIGRIWHRCPTCGKLEDVSDNHKTCSACAAELPVRPAFW